MPTVYHVEILALMSKLEAEPFGFSQVFCALKMPRGVSLLWDYFDQIDGGLNARCKKCETIVKRRKNTKNAGNGIMK